MHKMGLSQRFYFLTNLRLAKNSGLKHSSMERNRILEILDYYHRNYHFLNVFFVWHFIKNEIIFLANRPGSFINIIKSASK